MNDSFVRKKRRQKQRRYFFRRLPLAALLSLIGFAVGFLATAIALQDLTALFSAEHLPKALQNGGVIFAVALVGAIVFLILRIGSDRIRFPEDVILLFEDDVPLLATLPGIGKAGEIGDCTVPTEAMREASRMFDVNVSYALRDSIAGRVIGIGMPDDVPDAVLLSVRLASALAADGKKVALVDCDLRTSPLAAALSCEEELGISEYLFGKGTQINVHKQLLPDVSVILGGMPAENPIPLLRSEKCGALFAALAARFDFVLVNLPPILPTSDAISLAGTLSGTVAAAREGRTRGEDLFESARRILSTGSRFLGVLFEKRDPTPRDIPVESLFSEDVRDDVPEGGEEI